MRSLWARVAQVRSTCKCSLCAPNNALVARRAAVAQTRRNIVRGDFFLVFSSTIAFEATVYDTVKKDERAKEWDRVIAEKREQVAAVDADHKRRVESMLENAKRIGAQGSSTRTTSEEIWSPKLTKAFYRPKIDSLKDTRALPMETLNWEWPDLFSWASQCDALREASGFQNWRGVPLSFLLRISIEEVNELVSNKSLLARYYGGPSCEELIPSFAVARASLKKIQTVEWSVLKMTLRLLEECRMQESTILNLSNVENAKAMDPTLIFDLEERRIKIMEANERLFTLRTHPAASEIYQSFPRPDFPRYGWDGGFHDECLIPLNQTLHSILQNLKSKEDLTSVITSVCVEILSTDVLPNIHVYNLLLVRFCQLREDRLVWIVLDSMVESHMRPNEITHSTLLRFFTMTDNVEAFLDYTSKMKGYSRGLTLANSKEPIHPLVRQQFRQFNGKVVIKARLNQEVYSSLIVGFLRFVGTRDAMFWYVGMINDGWRPTAEIFVNVLRCCTIQKDWAGGVAAWQEFPKEGIKVTAVAYQWMLRLCRSCGEERVFSDVLLDGIQRGALTSRILDLPETVLMGDVDIMLEKAGNNRISRHNLREASPSVRQRIQRLADDQGPHLIENAMYMKDEDARGGTFNMKALDDSARRAQALKRIRHDNEKKLDQVIEKIRVTTDETLTEVPGCPPSIKRYQFNLTLRDLSSAENRTTVLDETYRAYKKRATSEMEGAGREELPFPEIGKDESFGSRVASLDAWWTPMDHASEEI